MPRHSRRWRPRPARRCCAPPSWPTPRRRLAQPSPRRSTKPTSSCSPGASRSDPTTTSSRRCRPSAWTRSSGAWRCARGARPGSARAVMASWCSGCPATRSPRWSPSCSSRAPRSGPCRARPMSPSGSSPTWPRPSPATPIATSACACGCATAWPCRPARRAPTSSARCSRRRLRDRHRGRGLRAAGRSDRRRAGLGAGGSLDVGQQAVGQRRQRRRGLLQRQRAVGQELLEPAPVLGVGVARQPRGRLRRAPGRARIDGPDRLEAAIAILDLGSRRAAPRPAGTPRSRARRR